MARPEITRYFDGEGRNFMHECIDLSAGWCVRTGLTKMVIFTGTGEGPHYAATNLLYQEPYSHLQIVAVTPPVGRAYRTTPGDPNSPLVSAGINPAMRDELAALGVVIVGAHLPFKEIHNGRERASEWSRVAEAYGVLGGGFALCVQAALVACDAGAIDNGERLVVASADTALVVVACRTESFLSPTDGLLVEHVICRPMRYSLSKRQHHLLDEMWGAPAEFNQLQLPLPVEPAEHEQAPVVEAQLADVTPSSPAAPDVVVKPVKPKRPSAKRRKQRSE
jgi:hypothetical protein